MNFNKAGLLALTLLCAGQAHAQDWIWELTTKMEMQGMPPGMGTQKSTSCIPQGKESEPDEKQSDCKITDRSSSGKITRFTMKCKEGTAKMEHELISAERWRSKMQMTGTGRGEEMTILTEAKRMGPCDAAKDGMMSQEAKAQLAASAKGAQAEADRLARECQQSVAQWPGNPTAFSTYDSMAKTRKDILSGGSGPDARRMADASAPEISCLRQGQARILRQDQGDVFRHEQPQGLCRRNEGQSTGRRRRCAELLRRRQSGTAAGGPLQVRRG